MVDGWPKNIPRRTKLLRKLVGIKTIEFCWNVPQKTVAELTSNVAGLAFATKAETEALLERPKATVPQAVLHSMKLDDTAPKVPVQARDEKGRLISLQRYLYQTGTGIVTCDVSAIEKGGQVTSRTVKAVVTVNQAHVPGHFWERCMQLDPENAVREWLSHQEI